MRIERITAGRGATMAASPPAVGDFTEQSVRKSEEVTNLIDLFSKTQYRAKEVAPRVRLEGHLCTLNVTHILVCVVNDLMN